MGSERIRQPFLDRFDRHAAPQCLCAYARTASFWKRIRRCIPAAARFSAGCFRPRLWWAFAIASGLRPNGSPMLSSSAAGSMRSPISPRRIRLSSFRARSASGRRGSSICFPMGRWCSTPSVRGTSILRRRWRGPQRSSAGSTSNAHADAFRPTGSRRDHLGGGGHRRGQGRGGADPGALSCPRRASIPPSTASARRSIASRGSRTNGSDCAATRLWRAMRSRKRSGSRARCRHFSALTTRDVEIGGLQGRRGEKILHVPGRGQPRPPAMGRFPTATTSPRKTPPAMSASARASTCCRPGQLVARLEGEVMLAALARKVALIEITGPVRRRYNNTLRGLDSLPITLMPA